jgi:hypothetical protein
MKKHLWLIGLLALAPIIQAQTFDIEHAPAPLYRDLVFDGAGDPTVVFNRVTEAWFIFYTQRRANIAIQNLGDCYGTQIGLAVSETNGRTWFYAGTADLPQPDPGHNTFWAPQVNFDQGLYHMFVTYIRGVYSDWDGRPRILHYTSPDLLRWTLEKPTGMDGYIDASVLQMPDGSWKMWYKDKASHISVGVSKDLYDWRDLKKAEISDFECEGPIAFRWKGSYWLIVDECNLAYVGLAVYKSDDATHWMKNGVILNTPGKREDDNDQGRHADVVLSGDRAFIVYYTHPGRKYDKNNVEIWERESYPYRRCSLEVAELEVRDGKIFCDRDKYLRTSPGALSPASGPSRSGRPVGPASHAPVPHPGEAPGRGSLSAIR